MAKRTVNIGVIGCGLMGREFASAAARWCHLLNLDFQPRIVAACDLDARLLDWFRDNVPGVTLTTANYHELLASPEVECIYCAVPHNLHEQVYVDIIRAGRHLLGEKPFGIDRRANQAILDAVEAHPDVLVRCSSEFPFFPGGLEVARWIREERFGEILEVESGVWHNSDLNPDKPINWKRRIETNGEYGCMGDLGMHAAHIPLRAGWFPRNVRAQLVNAIRSRPDGRGGSAPCETWDNAILTCDVETETQRFPLQITTKRIAPGHLHTWYIRIWGTRCSVEYSTKNPKLLRWMEYRAGDDQAWREVDLPYQSAYPAVTGPILEFGFPDSMQQMWAAFLDELVNRDRMQQPFHCATPQEAAQSHELFTAALESQKTSQTVTLAGSLQHVG